MLVSHRSHTVALASAASFLAGSLATAPALADDEKPYGAGILLYGFGSSARIQKLGLATDEDTVEPAELVGKNLRLTGGGELIGGGIQVNHFIHGVRVGLGISAFGLQGTTLRHAALKPGYSITAAGAGGATLDVFIGYELLGGPVRPYLDLVGGFNGVSARIDLNHAVYGRVEQVQYGGWFFNFGPRAGVAVPLGNRMFFDFSGTYSLFGMERYRLVGGIGFWTR